MTGQKIHAAQTGRIVCGALIFLLLGGFAFHAAMQNIRHQETEDFGIFYQAARAMHDGRDIYAATNGHYIYPPFIAFVFQPLTILPEVAASIVWAAISAALLFLALWLGAKEIGARWMRDRVRDDRSWPWLIALIVPLILADKIHAMFTLGQTDSLMLLGFVGAFYLLDQKPILAGRAVGAAANIKYLSLICVPYFVLKRQYRAAVSSLFSFGFFMLLPAIEIGFAELTRYLAIAFGGLAGMIGFPAATHGAKIFKVGWEKSLSFTSATFRFTLAHEMPDAVAAAFLVILFLVSIGIILTLSRRQGVRIFNHGQPDSAEAATLEWATLIFVALVFSPQTTSRHMILLALVYTVAFGVLFRARTRGPRAVLAAAMLIMIAGLSLPFNSLGVPQILTPWRAIGGPSWCALLLTCALAWSGSRALRQSDLPNE